MRLSFFDKVVTKDGSSNAVQPIERGQRLDPRNKGEPSSFEEILKRERERVKFVIPNYPIPGEKQA